MGPVLALVALAAIPKALIVAPTNLLQAIDKQRSLIAWGLTGGAVSVALDILLIPKYGAMGAAAAKGTGQAVALIGVWTTAARLAKLDLRLKDFGRIAAAGAVMAAGVVAVLRVLPRGYAGMMMAIAAGAAIWAVALRLVSALDGIDAGRFVAAGQIFPRAARPFWVRLVGFAVPTTRSAAAGR
jgi:O-antigen/teichoic acid export membrane protein